MFFEINQDPYIKDVKIISAKKFEYCRGFFGKFIEINTLKNVIFNMSDIDIYTIDY